MLRSAYLNAGINFFFTTLPFLVAMSCFYTYTLGFGEILTADKAFVSLAYLNTIRMPMGFLPIVIVYLVQCKVSLDRLNKYLNNEDVAPDAVKHDSGEKARLPDGYSQILRSYAFGPSGLKDYGSAMLHCKI